MSSRTRALGVELLFLANLVGALVAAIGAFRNEGWGWLLGIVIVGTSVCLYLAQETVGLPGMPKAWLEPSRLVSLLVDAAYVAVAWRAGGTLEPG